MAYKRVILRTGKVDPAKVAGSLTESQQAHFIAVISVGGDWLIIKDRANGYKGTMSDLYLAAYLWRYYYGPSKVDKEGS
jgi:hypothetical protein